MKFEFAYGYPVATVHTIDDVLEYLNIRPWERLAEPVTLTQHLEELDRLIASPNQGPQGERLKENKILLMRRALGFVAPHRIHPLVMPNGDAYVGVVTEQSSWAMTFAPIDDGVMHNCMRNPLIPLVAEYKVGGDRIAISPPAGIPLPAEMAAEDPFKLAAQREFEEEFGIKLRGVERIGLNGVPIACRTNSAMCHMYYGEVKLPIERALGKLDETEVIGGFFMRLFDWIEHLYVNGADELSASAITLVAMVHSQNIPLPKCKL